MCPHDVRQIREMPASITALKGIDNLDFILESTRSEKSIKFITIIITSTGVFCSNYLSL